MVKLFEISVQAGITINARELAQTLISTAFVRRLSAGLSNQPLDQLSDSEIERLVSRCPAVATLLHVIREYFHTLVQSNLMRFEAGNRQPMTPKKSDFGDLMHLFYAPYVDIFRCDARFGAHLKSYKPIRSKIAARRGEILDML